MRWILTMTFAAGLCALAAAQDKPQDKKPQAANDKPAAAKPQASAGSVLDYKVKDIDGKDVDLSKYKGRVVLIVNVASQCGMTPQYEQLQGLHDKYAKDGLAVLGFPANDFGQQEPGSEAEIKKFCSSNYSVSFDMFSKVSTKGPKACDVYKYLTSKESNPQFAGDIKWNFTKFLIDRHGKVVGRWEPRTKPDAPEVTAAIEKALAEKP
jgi:glutathione peroxidase